MKRILVLIGLGVAVPASAADGVFVGEGVYEDGRLDTCRGMQWRLTLEGPSAKAKLIPYAGSAAAIRDVYGTVAPDGHIVMSYVAGYGSSSGKVDIDLQQNGDTVTGHSQSLTCRYRITLKRS